MDLSLNDLKYFEIVSETLNISRAAERIGISQPALSVALQKLERAFGVPLFVRSRSGIQLTHAGERLRRGVGDFQYDWKRLSETVLRGEEEISGHYVFGCHPSVAIYSLPQVFPELLSRYPIEIGLVHDLSRKIAEGVISFRIDFGIVVNPWEHPDLVIRPIWEDTVTLFGLKDAIALQAMDGSGVLICDTDLMQTQSILKDLARRGLKFKRVIHSSSLEVITTLVASGAGIGILPARVASRETSIVPIKTPKFRTPFYKDRIALIYRGDRQRSKAARTLSREIERLLKQPGRALSKTRHSESRAPSPTSQESSAAPL